jgi:hypothetical protein
MKEPRTTEMLSRLVDDDLSPAEDEELRTLMLEDPEAAGLFEDFRRTRTLLRASAENDKPPAMLDDLLVDLRRQGRPAPRGWLVPVLASAALVVLGFAAVLQMRRSPVPDDFLRAAGATPSPVFVLSALPGADENSPLGPLEELLAEPYPPPAMLDAEPLVVVGPLPEPPPE